MFHPLVRISSWCLLLSLSMPSALAAPAWVQRSNQLIEPVLKLQGWRSPEYGTTLGLEEFDSAASRIGLELDREYRRKSAQLLAELEARHASEADPRVRQDLAIVIDALKLQRQGEELQESLMLPYIAVARVVFNGMQGLLDARNAPQRQAMALQRLKKYIGADGGLALTEQAKAYTAHFLANKALIGPYVRELQTDFETSRVLVEGIAEQFRQAGLDGWQADHATLKAQIEDYQAWLQSHLQPRARQDNRLPPELYAHNLRSMGVTMPVHELEGRALVGFAEIRDEMQLLAKRIAAERKLADSDYRAVIKALKASQFQGEEILPFYQDLLKRIEAIVEREQIVTLPRRKANIRLATDAESAELPAPFMSPPRLVDNQGEYGEFVLPLNNPTSAAALDDFTHQGFAWTLTVHEARPGHELQFARMVEEGVSSARAIYAFNSANVEGWALYAEAVMKEFLPLEGQLFSLQARQLRAARAFLDPMVNQGRMTPDQARQFLIEEVVLSQAFAQQEVDRYAFRLPGQATAYYFGYLKLRELRLKTEMALGKKFRQKAYHDFLLSQGLLPPEMLAQAVETEFLPRYRDQGPPGGP